MGKMHKSLELFMCLCNPVNKVSVSAQVLIGTFLKGRLEPQKALCYNKKRQEGLCNAAFYRMRTDILKDLH